MKGKVITGFSKPYVALYSATEGVVSYSSGQELAEGVGVSIQPEVSDPQNYYLNNAIGETIGGEFIGGTATLTVNGLKQNALKLITGAPTADAEGFLNYGKAVKAPFVGLGFIIRYLSEGVTSYCPVILKKAVLNPLSIEANTQGEEVEFQSQELEFALSRDDSADAVWQRMGGEVETEADAEEAIQTALGIS